MKRIVPCPTSFEAFQAAERSMWSMYGCCELIDVHHAGVLDLPSGVIVVAGDLDGRDTPLADRVMPGVYPVLVAMGVCVHKHGRAKGAILRISDEEPVEWKVARTRTDVVLPRVDKTAGFISLEGNHYFAQEPELRPAVINRLSENGWGNCRLPESSLNLIAFNTGVQDRNWGLYWGLGVNGGRVCLFAEFNSFHRRDPGHRKDKGKLLRRMA